MIPDEEEMRALVGHRFPGGRYTIEHWENFLLSDATGAECLSDSLAHPAHLFHVAINGVGTSITELFSLAKAVPGAAVSIGWYDWEIDEPLREDVTYVLDGGVEEYERDAHEGGATVDSFVYRIRLAREAGEPVATVGFRWHFWRPATEGASA